MHQAVAIMYCTQQVIQGENFCDWLKIRENRESFPTRKFCRIQYIRQTTRAHGITNKYIQGFFQNFGQGGSK